MIDKLDAFHQCETEVLIAPVNLLKVNWHNAQHHQLMRQTSPTKFQKSNKHQRITNKIIQLRATNKKSSQRELQNLFFN